MIIVSFSVSFGSVPDKSLREESIFMLRIVVTKFMASMEITKLIPPRTAGKNQIPRSKTMAPTM